VAQEYRSMCVSRRRKEEFLRTPARRRGQREDIIGTNGRCKCGLGGKIRLRPDRCTKGIGELLINREGGRTRWDEDIRTNERAAAASAQMRNEKFSSKVKRKQ